MSKKVLMIIAPKMFRDEELFEPKSVFEKEGFLVTTASKGGVKEAVGKMGGVAKVDIEYSTVRVDEYEAVVFVGGSGAKVYFDDEIAHDIARNFYENNKVTAAICIAPWILASAGLASSKEMTAFPEAKEAIELAGGIYTGNDVEVDGLIVTANGPSSAKVFAEKIVELLKNKR